MNRALGGLDLALCLAFSLALPAGQVLFKRGAKQTRRIDGGADRLRASRQLSPAGAPFHLLEPGP